MAREWIVAGWAAALVLAGGCSKSDPLQDRFAQQGSKAQRNKDLADIPLADPPKILPHTHFAAGRLFETQGSIGKAIEQYRKAVAVNHNFAEAYHRLGRMLNIANQHDEALSAFTRAVELGPKIAAYRNDLGFELMYVARWNEAESQLRKAIELDPALARAHVNLALTLSRMERFDEALASFRAVLPEADAHYNLGLMYRGQKRYAEAVASFRRVLDIQPKFSAAKLQLDQMTANPPVEQTATTKLAQADSIDPVKTGPAGIASQPLPTDATIAPQALPSVATGAPTGTPARNAVPDYLSRLIEDLGGSENAPQSAMAQAKADITLSESYAKAPSTETTNASSQAAMTQSGGAEPLTVAEWRIETPATEDNDEAEAESDTTARLFAADGIPSLPIQYGPTAGEDEAFDPTSDQIVAPPNSWTRWNGEVITFRALREILNNEANCIHDENLVDSDANAHQAVAEGEIEVLSAAGDEAGLARQPSGFATGRPTITVEPSEQGADSLILRALASATGDSDWRTPFADMMQLAAVLRNEHLCWRNSQEAEAAQLAATTRVVPARNVIARPQPADSAVGPTVENTQQTPTGPPAFGSPIDRDDPRQE